jgi:hypothetical protein
MAGEGAHLRWYFRHNGPHEGLKRRLCWRSLLCCGNLRCHRERGSTRGQTQQSTRGGFILMPPVILISADYQCAAADPMALRVSSVGTKPYHAAWEGGLL